MTEKKPSIILFISDQHNRNFAGCYGDQNTCTPSLDSLARDGVVFENAYCSSPLCVPSRMSFMTARHCHHIQVWGNSDFLESDIPTFAHGLGLTGYRTVLVGRMHFLGGDQLHGFQERLVGDMSPSFLGRNVAKERYRGYFGIIESVMSAGRGYSHDLAFDQAVTAEACRVLYDHETSRDKRPLAMVVSYISPHDPFIVYDRYFRLFAGPRQRSHKHRGTALTHPFYREERKNFAGIAEAVALNAVRAYSSKVHFMDEQIGRVLECFRASPLSKKAITAYLSDHGEMAGDKGLWGKSVFYDSASRVPVIISAPGLLPAGKRIKENISLLDIAPTLLDLVHAPPLPGADGRTLSDLIRGKKKAGNVPVFAELSSMQAGGPCRMLRMGDWKLNVYRAAPSELFNLQADPEEIKNLAARPEYAGVMKKLSKLIYRDGWNAEAIKAVIDKKMPDRKYLVDWTQKTDPKDPIQWGLPAPL